jgi:type III restriction enzyme
MNRLTTQMPVHVRRFTPDDLVRVANSVPLILEVKGKDTPQDQTKREFLGEWVEAVNEHGGFGNWAWAVSFRPGDTAAVLERAMGGTERERTAHQESGA